MTWDIPGTAGFKMKVFKPESELQVLVRTHLASIMLTVFAGRQLDVINSFPGLLIIINYYGDGSCSINLLPILGSAWIT